MFRYGDAETGEWGAWHDTVSQSEECAQVVQTTVEIGESCFMSGYSCDRQSDHVSLVIQNRDTSKRFWFQNSAKDQITSDCLHHSPVGATLSHISGDDMGNLRFNWLK